MSAMEIEIQSFQMPSDADELRRLVEHLNITRGARGWSIGGVTTVAASAALMFVFQKPVLPDNLATTNVPEEPTAQPAEPRRRRRPQ
jgi:hypothetical protein